MSVGVAVWQQHRSELNHDWLKNRFIVPLNSGVSLAIGEIEDERLAEHLLNEVVPRWLELSAALGRLIETFEGSMSPQQVITRNPFLRFDQLATVWIGELVHQLWIVRYNVPELVQSARTALARADREHDVITRKIDDAKPAAWSDILVREPEAFSRFRNACQDVAESISRFPSDIRPT